MTPIRLHTLIFGVQTDPQGLLSTALGAAACLAYVMASRRERRRGRRWPLVRTAAFLAGFLAVWVATGSGLAAYDESSATLHVVQHVLLMMVGPPLLCLGRPLILASRTVPGRPRSWITAWMHSTVVRVGTGSAPAAVLYVLSMYIYWLSSSIYRASIERPLLHQADHLLFLLVGFIYWDSLLGEHPSRGSDGAERLVAALVVMPFEAILGVLMTLRARPLYPLNSMAGTASAGRLFVALAMLSSGTWLLVMFRQWIRRNMRRERALQGTHPETLTAGSV